ncbi:MAG TPA: ribose-phosphate pyrophosphokinase [Bacilli bacterium]|nr:MAG: Ribose-phosphate pyrophosphokinase [Tenericutes bacterium ADurb.BinA124]HNZ50074.1 ribose-phosphate pyrophosphokinase [Bacilli bacterium]HPX84825.1 ribose-phosphate pyrophosphokinase [Bacilli bacterium]
MAEINGKKIKFFTLNSNPELAKEIADYVNIPLAECTLTRFADGEVNINIAETVRGHHVFVFQSTSEPVNDHYMELLIMMDALRRASARTINVIMPYYGYSRQDRKALARQPISAKLVADLLTVAGATRVVSMDLHAGQIQGFFNIPIDNFEAAPVMVRYIKEKKLEDIVIVSPDHGGTTRARKFALNFNAPIAIIDKRRPRPNVAEVMNIIGEVEDKNCIIVDDIVDTAGTITIAADALKAAGAKDVYVIATHPILSGDACNRIQNSQITELITTNSIRLKECKKIPKIRQLSVARIFAQGIMNIIEDKPISDLFNYNPLNKF